MIPIAEPSIGKDEIQKVKEVLKSKFLTSGKETKKFEEEFSDYVNVEKAVATNTGTSALHTALNSLGIGEGDEVITTSFSFISTATCILMANASPVFCDVKKTTYNINPEEVKEKINKDTEAIIAVHLFGQPCDMEALSEISEDYEVPLIEDACQAHGAEFKGKKVGSIGDIGCFSFYPTKNMTTGEGGMLTIDSEEVEEKARKFINHGQSDKYKHEHLGYNYRMTNISAALGRVQLRKLDEFNAARMRNAEFYNEKLKGVRKPRIREDVKHVYHQYSIWVDNRQEFIEHLEKNEVGYGIHYPTPIHQQPLFKNTANCPNAEGLSDHIISIPVHQGLNKDQVNKIAKTVNNYEGI